MNFSEIKFKSLNEKRQIKKVLDSCIEIDKNWENKQLRIVLMVNLSNCLNWISENKVENFEILQKNLHLEIQQRDFMKLYVPYEQKFHLAKKDNDLIILKENGARQVIHKIPLAIILDDLRSTFNVGSVFRTSECLGISELALCGYTPLPDQKKVKDTAMGTEKFVKWTHFTTCFQAIEHFRKKNYAIYALETTANASSIFETNFPEPLALVLGNEALGISNEILLKTDKIIKIPVFGWKNSLNVGVAFSICAYQIRNCWMDK